MNIIIKISSKLISEFLPNIVSSIKKINNDNNIIVVSSGAGFLGDSNFDLNIKNSLVKKQVLASLGQPLLIEKWKNEANHNNLDIAQILLTQEEIFHRKRCLYLRETLDKLLENNIIPIINENDAISIQENSFGENDLLAAKIAVSLYPSDLLIFLCDQNGVYTKNPSKYKDAELISKIYSQKDLDECVLEEFNSEISKGGIQAKIKAAFLAAQCGVKSVIANGKNLNIQKIIEEKSGTIFVPSNNLSSYKSWILVQQPKGEIIINKGAEKAIKHKNGNSLLSVGIVNYKGNFNFNDVVVVKNESQKNIAVGIVNYSDGELKKIIGKHSSEIESILGYSNGSEIIHRDKMVVEKV